MIHFESVPDSKLTRIYFPPQKSQFFVNSLFKYGKEDKLFSKTVGQANQINTQIIAITELVLYCVGFVYSNKNLKRKDSVKTQVVFLM